LLALILDELALGEAALTAGSPRSRADGTVIFLHANDAASLTQHGRQALVAIRPELASPLATEPESSAIIH
jgi:hypothetical protein